MYDDKPGVSGDLLKAEVRRASVMAKRNMARVNQRKQLAQQSPSSVSLRDSGGFALRDSAGESSLTLIGLQSQSSSFGRERNSESGAQTPHSPSSQRHHFDDDKDDGEESIPVQRYQSEMSATSWGLDGGFHDDFLGKESSDHEALLNKSLTSRRGARQQTQYLSWLDMSKVEMVIIGLIILNMWCLALETDNPRWPWWDAFNIAFLAIYVMEILLRMVQKGPLFLLLHARSQGKYWIWYDLIVIILGVADMIAARQSGGSCVDWHSGRNISMICADPAIVRFLMLCRLLRAVRILRMISDLYTFVKQLVSMITGTISWILLVIFLFCFVLAIIFTRLLGHGLLVSETASDAGTVREMFRDVPSSLFALFQLTTADDWARIALPVISARNSEHPVSQFIWRLFFIFFITFMSWTMLSLLTAVASEEMMTLKSASKADENLRQELERQGLINFLCDEFERADVDENGVLDKTEFMELMTRDDFRAEMRNHGLSLEERDVGKTWDTFDVDESGELTIEELVYGFSYLQEGLATKHVASIGYGIKRFQIASEAQFTELVDSIEAIDVIAEGALKALDRQQYINKQQWNYFLSNQAHQAKEELEELEDERDMVVATVSSRGIKKFTPDTNPPPSPRKKIL